MKIRVVKYVDQTESGASNLYAKKIVTKRIGQEARGNFENYGEGSIVALFDDDQEIVLYKGEWEEVKKRMWETIIVIRSDFDPDHLSLEHLARSVEEGYATCIGRKTVEYNNDGEECPGCNHPECPNFLGKIE